MIRIIGLAAAFALIATPAHADPVTLLATTIASLLASVPLGLSATGLGLISKVLATGLIAGGLLALSGLRGGAKIDPGQFKSTFEEQEVPEINAIGRVELGGLKVFGNANEEMLYRLIAHSKGELDGIENYYLGGKEVIVNASGLVTSKPYLKESGVASWVNLESKVGDGTETAWADLITDFPALWTANHRVRGIFQSLVRYENPGFDEPEFLRLYPSGVPDLRVRARVLQPYDPRTASNAWTTNGILCALHVVLACYPNLTIDDFDLPFISIEADRADALVATLTGTEPRSTCSGAWTSEQERSEVVTQVLRSVGAIIVPRPDGLIGLQLVDDDRVAEVTLPVRHLIGLQWKAGPDSVERPNICRVKFYSPARNYEMAEIDLTGIAWARIDDEVDRVGPQYFDVELPFCTSASQAQRLARRMFALARADVGLVTYNMVGLAAWEARCIAIEFPDEIGTVTVANDPPRVLDDRGQVEIPFVVWPELTVWNPAEDEAAAPTELPEFASSTLEALDAPSEATVVEYPDASHETRVRVEYTHPRIPEVVYRGYNAEGNPEPWRPMEISDWHTALGGGFGSNVAYVALDLTGDVVDFRIREFAAGANDSSPWSPILQVTLAEDNTATGDPSIILVGSDITVTAPTDLNVAYLDITGTDAPGEVQVQPGEQVTFAVNPANGPWSATAYTSNGTASGTVTQP